MARHERYLARIGSLFYVSVQSRPDTSCHGISPLQAFNVYGTAHLQAAMNLLHYLKVTQHFSLTYTRQGSKPVYAKGTNQL